YNRPRFLASPAIPLAAGQAVSVLSPYGGTLLLEFSHATPGQAVTVTLQGVAKHPFLDADIGGNATAFINALNSSGFDWAEIKMNGLEIHSRADRMKNVISTTYGNDARRYLDEIRLFLHDDIYQLAGFSGFALPAAVLNFCSNAQWSCTDASLHQLPDTQHFNIDAYTQCGDGCSGQPIDLKNMDPRGAGESHEMGHNMQVGNLMIYAGISAEVSNEIFPLHKYWRLLRDYGDDRTYSDMRYDSAFNMIRNARQDTDPIESVYQQMWKDTSYAAQSGERRVFYMQWMHYWTQRMASVERGWDIFTLLYLHERQLRKADWATYKDRLGYSRYASRPAENGNDNMLIALSWITKRDQRATFDLWGIRYSAAASTQVASYGFAREPAFYYAKVVQNDYSDVRKVDMTVADPVWPF
ncbi:MAG TPA: ImpA family metalloprotease, partial [Moraxellaceae bacterium]